MFVTPLLRMHDDRLTFIVIIHLMSDGIRIVQIQAAQMNPHHFFFFFFAHFSFLITAICIISSLSSGCFFRLQNFPHSSPKCLSPNFLFFVGLLESPSSNLLLVKEFFNWNRFPTIIIVVLAVAFHLIPFCQLLSDVLHRLACFLLHTKDTLLSHLVAIVGVTAL